jgi:hypothetical protein
MGILEKLFGPPNIEKLKERRDVDGLVKALSHEDAYVRCEAAKALGDLKDGRAVEPLLAVLKDKEYLVRRAAEKALGRIGAAAVEPLVAALKDKDANVRGAAAEALGEIGDARAVEPLIAALKDKEGGAVRSWAAWALGVIEDARAVEPLVAALMDGDWSVRSSAEKALERIGGPEGERAPTQQYAFDEAVDMLLEIYRQHPEGFVRGERGAAEQEIRRIGRMLHKQGGIALMRTAHAKFARQCGIYGAARNLEFMWDGVGDWLG